MTALKGQTIGLIGLGLMGQPMGRNLLDAGAELVVYNRSPEKIETMVAAGAVAAASPEAVSKAADVVIIMSIDTKTVETILFGDDGVIGGVRNESLIIDMGTSDAEQTRGFAKLIEAARGRYIDAPVSGGTVGAEQATLTIMAGAEAADIERARPIFEVLGSRLTHIGKHGAGQVAKTANQMIVGLTIGAVAEALVLAKRAGADPAKVRDALKGGFADSRILDLHGERMITDNYEPGGKCATQCKDMELALALAEQVGLDLPGTRLNRELYVQAIEAGWGGLDHSVLYKVIDKT
jgi:3-hydroxyisobutyrate dehydrogenase-like beta-hydroxyacid dehydrogenase